MSLVLNDIFMLSYLVYLIFFLLISVISCTLWSHVSIPQTYSWNDHVLNTQSNTCPFPNNPTQLVPYLHDPKSWAHGQIYSCDWTSDPEHDWTGVMHELARRLRRIVVVSFSTLWTHRRKKNLHTHTVLAKKQRPSLRRGQGTEHPGDDAHHIDVPGGTCTAVALLKCTRTWTLWER